MVNVFTCLVLARSRHVLTVTINKQVLSLSVQTILTTMLLQEPCNRLNPLHQVNPLIPQDESVQRKHALLDMKVCNNLSHFCQESPLLVPGNAVQLRDALLLR